MEIHREQPRLFALECFPRDAGAAARSYTAVEVARNGRQPSRGQILDENKLIMVSESCHADSRRELLFEYGTGRQEVSFSIPEIDLPIPIYYRQGPTSIKIYASFETVRSAEVYTTHE